MTTVTTGTSVLTDVGGSADIVLAETVTETEAVEDALSEEGEGDATVLEGTGTEKLVSDLANTATPLMLFSKVCFVVARSFTKDS